MLDTRIRQVVLCRGSQRQSSSLLLYAFLLFSSPVGVPNAELRVGTALPRMYKSLASSYHSSFSPFLFLPYSHLPLFFLPSKIDAFLFSHLSRLKTSNAYGVKCHDSRSRSSAQKSDSIWRPPRPKKPDRTRRPPQESERIRRSQDLTITRIANGYVFFRSLFLYFCCHTFFAARSIPYTVPFVSPSFSPRRPDPPCLFFFSLNLLFFNSLRLFHKKM